MATAAGILLATAVLPGAADAQSIVTDRPDFVESSSTVGKGSIQIEGSVAFAETETSGTESEDFATPFLFRVGIADAWELRVESAWYTRNTLEDETALTEVTTQGVSDISVGTKWAFWAPETGAAPAMAVLVHARLPTGSDDFGGEVVRPTLRVSAEWALGDWGIGIMPGVVYNHDGEEHFTSGMLGAVVGRGITDSLRAFAELSYVRIAKDVNGGSIGFFDFGGTYLLSQRWQLDAAVLLGITDAASDVGYTFGLSALLPR